MTTLQAIFFDHDGTLVDTEPLWAIAKTKVSAAYGVDWTEEDTLDSLGKPASFTLERMQEKGAQAPAEELYQGIKEEMNRLLASQPAELLPGMAPLLQELAQAQLPAGIVTNGTRAVASATAALAPAGLFKTLVTDEDVSRPKPDPEPYLKAAQNLGVDPAACLALEDSESGTRSALAAGMKVIVLPGLTPVPAHLGLAHLKHTELSLAGLQALFAA
ncbi:MAG: HAD family phosphatase [Rothia sp. (in: high G+C Gram-positive bacteria)]|nr:HAD family phosphatase [Rothia sp. (in: high G+C Gram-positive bacteria)]